ncbi:MAG: hypothetical protein OXI30_12415 [Chloroflexota bacterium]|nr:hypothetical protein [Chloroflexota bacterium]MYE26701.1 hypothetical protein [Chloroflexota bacterium]
MLILISKCAVLILLLIVTVSPLAQDDNDEENSEASCTLAEQIMSSNTGEKVGDCPILEGMEAFQLREDIVLTERLPAITSYFIIDGNGHTISGDNMFRIFKVDGGKLTILNLHMRDGSAELGSAISVVAGGRLLIEDSTLENCSAYSGTIFIRYGTLHINRSNFLSNTADRGGAIYNAAAGEIVVSHSRLEYNSARRGGAIYHYVGKGVIANSSFRYNQASERGGAIYSAHAGLQISHSAFSQNIAETGGAIDSRGTYLSVFGSTIELNRSLEDGAGIYVANEEIFIRESSFKGNVASQRGGGVFANRGTLIVSKSDFRNNASHTGPGIYMEESSAMIIDTDFTGNSAADSDEQLYGVESEMKYY